LSCNNCNTNYPIVNKKYSLCANCNSIRLSGKSIQERQAESATKYRQKAFQRFREKVTEETDNVTNNRGKCDKMSYKNVSVSANRKPIRQQTKKEAGVKSELLKLKNEIRLEAIQNDEYYCKGCGKAVGLDCSHILSVGKYKHLELIRDNVQLLCRQDHQIWESGTIQQQIKLHCFIDNLQFIYLHDPFAHQRFITRLEEYKDFLIWDVDQAKIMWIEDILFKCIP
jgi:5-methylcytosine-specific restriction endonuclease McrA